MRTARAASSRPLLALASMGIGVLGSLLFTADASAYCRTRSVAEPANFVPQLGQCWSQGKPLYWAGACVGYSLQQNGSSQIPLGNATTIVDRAFSRWSEVDCSATTGAGRPSIQFVNQGPVACGEVRYNQDKANQHVIVFRDDAWPYTDSSNTLAFTTVTYDVETGEIYDADIEINSNQHKLSTSAIVSPEGYDFDSIITHEAGHFFGLAHSDNSQATMYPSYARGSLKMRTPLEDDIAGVCTIYHPDGNRSVSEKTAASGLVPATACDPTPRHGFSTECAAPANDPPASGGCTVLPTSGSQAGSWGLLGVGFLFMARRKKSLPQP